MGRLKYTMNVSLDGYVETSDHSLDWAPVDEVMRYWSTAEADHTATPEMLEFARIWNPKPKVVFSTTLESVPQPFRLVRGDVVDINPRG